MRVEDFTCPVGDSTLDVPGCEAALGEIRGAIAGVLSVALLDVPRVRAAATTGGGLRGETTGTWHWHLYKPGTLALYSPAHSLKR